MTLAHPLMFWVLAAVAVVSGIVVITKRNPLGSATALALNLVALAGLFATLMAPFLFVIQILVYAGAVVVLIIFVIMLLNLREQDLRREAIQGRKFVLSAVACLAATILLLAVVGGDAPPAPAAVPAYFGSVEAIADLLFTDYLLPFEVVSLLLLVGIVGAVVIAKREE